MVSKSEEVRRFITRMVSVRKARSLTQRELADRVGLTHQAISKVEIGWRGVTLADAIAISAALDVPLGDMVSDRPLALTVRVPID